jgi:hypothetical protein
MPLAAGSEKQDSLVFPAPSLWRQTKVLAQDVVGKFTGIYPRDFIYCWRRSVSENPCHV